MFKKVLLGVSVLALLTSCEKKEHKETIRLARTLEVQPVHATSTYTYNGIAKSDVAARLSFNIAGKVKKVYVKVGQKVKKGHLIAEIDNSLMRLKVNEADASLRQVQTKLNHAKARYNRIKKLYVNRSSSLSDLDNARTAMDSAKASYRAMQNRLEQAKLQLTYTKLKAPINGSISDVLVRKSENVTSAVTIATIGSTKSIKVPVSVPGSIIDEINEGQRCLVSFDSISKRKFEAKVTVVGHSSSNRTTTFPVTVKIKKPSKKMHPGMTANVTFVFSSRLGKGNYIIPAHAVLEDDSGTFVYIVQDVENGVGVIAKKNVKRGKLTANGILILDGLKRKMHVLTAGMSRVSIGQKVRVEL